MCGCGCFGRVIAFVFSLSFVLFFAISLWAYNIDNVLLRADEELAGLLNEDVYDTVLPLVLPALSEPTDPNTDTSINVSRPSANTPTIDAELDVELGSAAETTQSQLDFPTLVSNLDQEDWESITQEIIPGDYLEEQTQDNLVIFLEYVRGDAARLEIVFDTSVLRNNLLGQPGDRMVNRIFSSFPDCDADGEAALVAFLNEDSDMFPYCQPNDADLQRQVFTTLNNTKDELASDIPETWNIRERIAEEEGITLQEVDESLYLALQRPSVLGRELRVLNFLLAAAFLAFIVIVTVDSGTSFFRWMGWSVMFGGIFSLIPLLIVPIVISAEFAAVESADAATELGEEAFRGFVSGLVTDITRPLLIQGALMVAIGFLCLFFSILLPNPDEDLLAQEADERRLELKIKREARRDEWEKTVSDAKERTGQIGKKIEQAVDKVIENPPKVVTVKLKDLPDIFADKTPSTPSAIPPLEETTGTPITSPSTPSIPPLEETPKPAPLPPPPPDADDPSSKDTPPQA